MKNLTCILLAVFLTGCINQVVQPDTQYRGEAVLGDVVGTNPVKVAAEPLEMERTIPFSEITVTPSAEYSGLDLALMDTVQVVLRPNEGDNFWIDSATPID